MPNPLFAHAWASSPERVAVAVAVTLGFAVLARGLRGVTFSGAVAGGIACFLLFGGAGPAAFAALAALFAMTWASTRLGYRQKLALGLAERREGRNGWQVLANLAAAAASSVIFSATGNRAWLVATAAALCEAATDTVASEIGQYRKAEARLITSGKRVPAGTDGGITISGSIAGLGAGLGIGLMGLAGGMLVRSQFWIPVAAGFGGMLADSLLGATLQRRGWIDNRTVNFFSTLGAAALAYAISA
jgi:uncharacterized protein (TIGR00297 family)